MRRQLRVGRIRLHINVAFELTGFFLGIKETVSSDLMYNFWWLKKKTPKTIYTHPIQHTSFLAVGALRSVNLTQTFLLNKVSVHLNSPFAANF